MICKELLLESVNEEIDVEELWFLLQGVSKLFNVAIDITFSTKRKVVKIKVCGLRSKHAQNHIRAILMTMGFREVRRGRKGILNLRGLIKFRRGEVCLGRECKSNVPIYVDSRELLSHALIVGSTGTGKTTTTIHILGQLIKLKGLRIVVLDWHGEYLDKLNGEVIEPCIPRWINSEDVNILMDSITSTVELSPTQHYLLAKVINKIASEKEKVSLDDVVLGLKSVEEVARWVKESKYAILRRLEQLQSMLKICKQDYLVSKANIVNLSTLQDTFVKSYVSNFLLAWLRNIKRRMERVKVIVVVEEAHNISPKSYEGKTVLDAIVREDRKWGLYAYIITQSPTSISREIVKNASIKIIHGIREIDDARFIAQSIGLEKQWNEIIRFPRGQFLFSTSSRPVCVRLHAFKS